MNLNKKLEELYTRVEVLYSGFLTVIILLCKLTFCGNIVMDKNSR